MRVLFVAYQEAMEPSMQSQGLSYIVKLKERGVSFALLTFEKDKRQILATKSKMSNSEIHWVYLKYHKQPRLIATVYDVLLGSIKVFWTIKQKKIQIIHARGLIAALISFLPAKISKICLFFDSRGLLADKYVGGGLLVEDSITYKLMRKLEDLLLKYSNKISVETEKHRKIVIKNNLLPSKKCEVVPCCVDTKRFFPIKKKNSEFLEKYGLKDNFIFIYLGKTTTWYLMREMMGFVNVAKDFIPNVCFLVLTQDSHDYVLSEAKSIAPKLKVLCIKPGREDIPSFLSNSDVGIYFINSYKRYNSSPIKFGEYIASGLPVVINAGIGDSDEITKDNKVGVVIEKFSSYEYKKKIKELKYLLDSDKNLKTRCRETSCKELSLDKGVSKYLQIYSSILAPH